MCGGGRFCAVHHELDLAFLRLQHDRLLAQSPDHVERTLGLTAQRQFLHVRGDAAFDHRPQFFGDREESIRRTETVERLVRSLVVIVLHPQPNPLPRLIEAVELGSTEKLLPDRFPEPLHLAQRHRVMRLAAEVMDVILRQLLLEARLPAPGGVLPTVVGEHLLGHAVLRHGCPIDFQDVLRRLAAKQIQSHDVARVVIHKRNQVGVLAAQPECEDVALPHLVRRRPLEGTRLGWILRHFPLRLRQQPVLMQRPPHGFRAPR